MLDHLEDEDYFGAMFIDSNKEMRKSTTPTASDVSSDSSDDQPLDEVSMPRAPKSLAQLLKPRFWSLAVLAGLGASFPLSAACTAIVVILQRLFGKKPEQVPFNGKTAIVSGGKMTKSFVMIKQLKAQGCRVVLVETSKYWMVASRFSNCVDRFVTVPIPEKEPEAYLDAMVRLAEEEQADLFVPVTSPVASQYEARLNAVLPKRCHSWSLPPDEVEKLDDKVYFCQAAEALGLPVPIAHRVSSHAEVYAFNEQLAQQAADEPDAKHPRYILKNLQYDSMHRLDLFTLPCPVEKLEAYLSDITIDRENPWTVQTFIVGEEYSSCAICKGGRLLAFTDNLASISCFNYLPARSQRLREWVQTFVAARSLSGIVCIDFIVEADGTPYAIECNPRASSNITSFYNHPGLGAVLVHPDAHHTSTVEPLPSAVETYWLFSEVWGALTKPGLLKGLPTRAKGLLDALLHKKDAYFDAHDPLPFLAHFGVHLPTLLKRNIVNGNNWAKIDPCIGKMTEENGD
jgi:hypothetical protein